MNRKLFLYISCGLLVIVIISIYLISHNDSNSIYSTKKVTIEKYEKNSISNTFEITTKERINELTDICNTISLEQDEEELVALAIKNDIKIDLNNGIFFILQLDNKNYCYMENSNSNTNAIIGMPKGLLEYVNKVLEEN